MHPEIKLAKPKILVVDDSPKNLFAIELILKKLDVQIFKAISGNEGLGLTLLHDFFLVLLDVQMPEMDGFEMASLMKEDEKTKYIPIIFITAISKGEEQIFKGYESGAVDYLFKPIDANILLSKVKIFLELDAKKRELEMANVFLSGVLEAVSHPIHVISVEDYSILMANSAATQGPFSKNLKCFALIHGKEEKCGGEDFPCPVDEIKKIQKPVMVEQTIRTNNGREKILEVHGYPVFNTDTGKLESVIEYILDVTERKNMENNLKKAKQTADEANKAKSEFLSSMSHEIRTPMTAILGMADLLKATELTKSQEEYVDIYRGAGKKLMQIINDILDVSKIEAGKLELEKIEFDLDELIKSTCIILAFGAHKKGLEILYQISDDVPVFLKGDPTRLGQVLINLISNAIKFTPKGEIVLRVKRKEESDGMIVLLFSVTDTGLGIPEDKKKKIFESFAQVDSSVTRKYGGTGLGLTISQGLVKKMGGSICVESEKGKGTSFCFTANFGVTKIGEKRRQEYEDRLDIRGLKLLIADDNQTNRIILKEMLKNNGAEITEAENGQYALAEIEKACQKSEPFDLLLLDCLMPGLDGFEVAKRIKEGNANPCTVILMLTSDKREECIAKAKKLGIAEYVVKPIHKLALYNCIIDALGKQGSSST